MRGKILLLFMVLLCPVLVNSQALPDTTCQLNIFLDDILNRCPGDTIDLEGQVDSLFIHGCPSALQHIVIFDDTTPQNTLCLPTPYDSICGNPHYIDYFTNDNLPCLTGYYDGYDPLLTWPLVPNNIPLPNTSTINSFHSAGMFQPPQGAVTVDSLVIEIYIQCAIPHDIKFFVNGFLLPIDQSIIDAQIPNPNTAECSAESLPSSMYPLLIILDNTNNILGLNDFFDFTSATNILSLDLTFQTSYTPTPGGPFPYQPLQNPLLVAEFADIYFQTSPTASWTTNLVRDPMFDGNPDINYIIDTLVSDPFSFEPELYLSDTPQTYIITAQNQCGCVVKDSIVAGPFALETYLDPLPLSCEQYNIDCSGGQNGFAIVHYPTSGCPPYEFEWSNGNYGLNFSQNLPPGPFSVTVTDYFGHFVILEDEVIEPSPLIFSGLLVSEYSGYNLSCFGANDGYIFVDVQGGADCNHYSYIWNGPNGFTSTDSFLLNLGAGYYSLTVEDINGCSIQEDFILTQPNSMVLSPPSIQMEGCFGNLDGHIIPEVNGGAQPLSYEWYQNGNLMGVTDSTLMGIAAGDYELIITDANGCGISENFEVPIFPYGDTIIVLQEDACLSNDPINLFEIWNLENSQCSSFPFPFTSSPPMNIGTISYSPVVPHLLYCPEANLSGMDTLEFIICNDDESYCDTSYVYIIVEPVNDCPLPGFSGELVFEDSSYVFDLQSLLYDIEGDELEFVEILQQPLHGNIIALPQDSFMYTPNPHWDQSDVVQFLICELQDSSCCATASINFNIAGINDPPITAPDYIDSISENVINLPLTPINNDFDIEGSALVYCDAPTSYYGGTTTIEDDLLLYTPFLNYCGEDTIAYCITDGTDSAWNYIYIVIKCERAPPLASPDTVCLLENQSVYLNVLANDFDPNDDFILIESIQTDPRNGIALIEDSSLFYTPDPGFCGLDSISYKICDITQSPLCDSLNGLVFFQIECINDIPISNSDTLSVDQYSIGFSNVLANDYDIEGHPLGIAGIVDYPNNCEAFIVDNEIVIMGPSDFFGTDTLVYLMCDNYYNGQYFPPFDNEQIPGVSCKPVGMDTACSQNTLYFTIHSVNQPPVSVDDFLISFSNQSGSTNIIINDYDPEGLDVSFSQWISEPSNGSISINESGEISYLPAEDFFGYDTVYYETCDLGAPTLCDTGMVVILIQYNGEIFVPNGISPNGDGNNDNLFIPGLESIPDAELFIYNRWGGLVYHKVGYTNQWHGQGNREQRLPEGTYFYYLKAGSHKVPVSGYVILYK